MDTQTDHGRRADGPFLDFLPSQAYGVCNLRERIAPLRRLSGSLSALILREPTTIPCTPPHSFCVLSDCPSPSVSACWGARALAGCTQQALTKLKMFSLMTSEPRTLALDVEQERHTHPPHRRAPEL